MWGTSEVSTPVPRNPWAGQQKSHFFTLHKYKTTRTKRGKECTNAEYISTNYIKQTLTNLENEFKNSFHWIAIRKHIFSIKNKNRNIYYNDFLSLNLSSHSSDVYFDLLYFRSNHVNVKISIKTFNKINSTQLIISCSNNVLNKINIHNLINNKSKNFPIKKFTMLQSYRYNVALGR